MNKSIVRALTAETNEATYRTLLEDIIDEVRREINLDDFPHFRQAIEAAEKFLKETPTVKERDEQELNWVEKIIVEYVEEIENEDIKNGEELQQYVFDNDLARDIAEEVESKAVEMVDWDKVFKALQK